MERKISAEEATILSCEQPKHGINLIDSIYDCPTCAYWLAETVAQCTEKSCKKCISLLRNDQSMSNIPTIDDYKSKNNGTVDEMRDGCDSYELLKCCDNIKTPTESNSPLNRCIARYRNEDFIDCPFSSCGCNYRASNPNQLNIHNENNIHRHMNMMMLKITNTVANNKTKSVSLQSVNKVESENNQQNGTLDNLSKNPPLEIKKLHERVATLEQELCEYKLDVKRLTMIVNKLSVANLRERSGTLVWQIDEFEKKVQTMLANPMTMFYSPDFYTDPYGYRFCGRISISSKAKAKDSLSFHVHMMQSENDFHLDWPFRGCIQIFLINEDNKQTQRDKIMTNEKSTAFQRPTSEISAHSFGFTEYANITSIMNDGFLSSDGRLTIKLHISIV